MTLMTTNWPEILACLAETAPTNPFDADVQALMTTNSFDADIQAQIDAFWPEILACLAEARALIQRGWCKGTEARFGNRHTASPHDSRARSFCLLGALRRAAWSQHAFCPAPAAVQPQPLAALARSVLIGTLSHPQGLSRDQALIWFNDQPERTQEEVLRLLDSVLSPERK